MTEEEKAVMEKAVLAAMYEQDEERDEARQQPEQLRLAGKAVLMDHQGGKVALARIDYVEALERTVREQQKQIEASAARVKKLELRVDRMMNIAVRRIASVESDVKAVSGNRWEY